MKVIAVLLNPTVDIIYFIDNFYVGGTFKVKKQEIYPVGKAISFSLAIRNLTKECNFLKVLACIGKREISLYSNFLSGKKIPYEIVPINDFTRSNKTIIDKMKNTVTHIREQGFKVTKNEFETFKGKLLELVEIGDICVFSGSLPPNLDKNTYNDLISACKERGAICALDTSSEALINGIKAKPDIIKPNLIELNQILKEQLTNYELQISFKDNKFKEIINKITDKANYLIDLGISTILITMGEKGAIFLSENESYYGYVQVKEPIDTVGCGDAFLAGFILNKYYGKDNLECFKWALAAGGANTLITGAGILKEKDARNLYDNLIIKKLD
ncbi:MAG: 1-phosphofructokinase family hexose kinase [Promethearchaeota archaeon]